jgi:hypothetical protein
VPITSDAVDSADETEPREIKKAEGITRAREVPTETSMPFVLGPTDTTELVLVVIVSAPPVIVGLVSTPPTIVTPPEVM